MRAPDKGNWKERVSLRDLPLAILGVLLLLYAVVRSITVSFSWDEAYTYLHHVQHGILWPDRFDDMGANHHLLNVWCMWLADRLLGPQEWMLRLPNVLSFVIYISAAIGLVRKVHPWPVALALFGLLTLHPYMLDMFSLARGYGMGMAFMFLGLVLLRRYASAPQLKTGILITACAGLAALSNLIFLNFLFAALAALMVLVALEPASLRSRSIKVVIMLAAAAPFMLATLFLAFQLKAGGSLYFGSGDLSEAIRSVAIKVFYHLPMYEDPVRAFKWAVGVAVMFPLLTLAIGVMRGLQRAWYPVLPGLLVLLFWAGGMIFEHGVFGTPWPHARTGVPIIPLLAFVLVTALMSPALGRFAGPVIAVVVLIPVVQLQARSLNTTYCIEWKASGEVRTMVSRIRHASKLYAPGRPAISVATGFESQMPLLYYRAIHGLHNLTVTTIQPDQAIARSDIYLLEFNNMDRVDTVNWELDHWGEVTNVKLFRDRRNFGKHWSLLHTEESVMDDGGWNGDVELSGDRRFGGAIKYVFNARTAGDRWLVIETPASGASTEDWVALSLGSRRAGEQLEERTIRTSSDRHLIHGDTLVLAFGPERSVMPGDSLHIAVWSATGARTMTVGRTRLRIYGETAPTPLDTLNATPPPQ